MSSDEKTAKTTHAKERVGKKNQKTGSTTEADSRETESKSGRRHSPKINTLAEVWNVLADASEPITAGEVGRRLQMWGSTRTLLTTEKWLEDSRVLFNAVFPNTVLYSEEESPILHTYLHKGSLHVVVEDPAGKELKRGDMAAVFQLGANTIPQVSLNRNLHKVMTQFEDIKDIAEDESRDPGKRYPPLALAAIVETKNEKGKKELRSAGDYDREQLELGEEEKKPKSPARKYYLKSILSPEEWQLISDMILVYPYLSERETDKLISAMQRMAPGSRQWKKLVRARKNPNAVRFDFIRKLENAIQKGNKVNIKYGRYSLERKTGSWRPTLVPDGKSKHLVHPYALTWSNGYYYLVGSVETKDKDGAVTMEMRNFRVDRILEVGDSVVPFDMPAHFNVQKYRDRSPVMYSGEVVPIKLRCHISMLSVLQDFFDTAIFSYSEPKDDYTTVRLEATENGTKLFAMQYAERVEVLEPLSLRKEVADALRAAASRYQNT